MQEKKAREAEQVSSSPMSAVVIANTTSGSYVHHAHQLEENIAFLRQQQRLRALQIVIGNTQLYGGAIKFTWQAKCDDGLLDLCIVRMQNFFCLRP